MSRQSWIGSLLLARHGALFGALAAVVIALQAAGGAYGVERGAYSDEAAHFMNGLLVRDYLTQGLGHNPVRFAEEYYVSYPKIAPLAWPPLFHALLGLFLLPGWPPHAASLVLNALVAAYAAWRLATLIGQYAPPGVAVVLAAAFLLTRAVMDMTSSVMVDVLVAALMLDATHWLCRFWSTTRRRDAVLFGLAAAGACLTKGNGVAVVLVPGLLVLFTRRFAMLRHPNLYVAAAIVAVLAVPPLLVSYGLAWSVGDFGVIRPRDLAGRLLFYATFFRTQLGSLPAAVAVVGLVAAAVSGGRNQTRPPVETALAALVTAVLLFHTSYQYFDGRYVLVAVAALLALIPVGVGVVAGLLRQKRAVTVAVYATAAVAFVAAQPVLPDRRPLGYRAAVHFLDGRDGIAGTRLLVVSDEHGEGAFVAEVAARPLVPPATVLRSSKVLSGGDWLGTDFALEFASAPDVTRELEDLQVSYVLVDSSPGDAAPPYWRAARDQMAEAISLAPERYQRVFTVNSGTDGCKRDIAIYRLTHRTPGPARPIRLDLTHSIGRVLVRD